jgi:hypothetical protein
MTGQTTIASMAEPSPAGWYPDPAGAATQRYFDGRAWTDHYQATPPRLPAEQRADLLDIALAKQLAATPAARVESHTANQAVIVWGGPPNHVVHALITIFTCGFWGIVWLIDSMTSHERRVTLMIPYGNVTRG